MSITPNNVKRHPFKIFDTSYLLIDEIVFFKQITQPYIHFILFHRVIELWIKNNLFVTIYL